MIRSFLLGLIGLLAIKATAQESSTVSPNELFRQGVEHFFAARPKESVAAFDKLLTIVPEAKPQLWQRGLSLYYAGDFKEGRLQFETHQTYNTQDVENAVWHFICVARSESVDAARKLLIPIEGDTRIPMKEVHLLFAGKGNPEDVLKAAQTGDSDGEKRNQLCYAHLYLGLYHEALGDATKAREHIVKAAKDYRMDHYMGRCAQVHAKLRGWE